MAKATNFLFLAVVSAIIAPGLAFQAATSPLLLRKNAQLRTSVAQPMLSASRLGRVAYNSQRIVMSSTPKGTETKMSREERLNSAVSNAGYKRVRTSLI